MSSWSEFHAAQRQQWRDDVANLQEEVHRLEQLVAERDSRIADLEYDVLRLNDEITYGRRI